MVTTNVTQLVSISTRHKEILERIKQSHGMSIREQIEMGIEYLDGKFSAVWVPFETNPQSEPQKTKPMVVTSFEEWIQDNEVKEEESGDIMYCVKNAPTTQGRFISEFIPDSGVFVRTVDGSKCILHLKSQKAASAFRIHLGIRANYQQKIMALSPGESARLEQSLADLIKPPKKTEP